MQCSLPKGALNRSKTTCQLYSRQKYLTELRTTRERSLVRHEDETILKDKEGNEPIYAEENWVSIVNSVNWTSQVVRKSSLPEFGHPKLNLFHPRISTRFTDFNLATKFRNLYHLSCSFRFWQQLTTNPPSFAFYENKEQKVCIKRDLNIAWPMKTWSTQ